ncbi:MAG: hypothetical protein JKY42_11070, partial [Flavobacteriales bacterium]|nr:hypothetical protein [Flavobacteriales bacterium]
MKKNILLGVVVGFSYYAGVGQADQNQSYVINKTYTSEQQSAVASIQGTQTSISYVDPYGRRIQSKLLNYSPDGRPLVLGVSYNEFGKEDISYLPYTNSVNETYEFDNNSIANQLNFYTNAPLVAHDNFPYINIEYDNSPVNFIRSAESIGDFWHDNSVTDNAVSAVKMTNGTGNSTLTMFGELDLVKYWEESNGAYISTTDYSENELVGYLTQSPEHATEVSFTDKQGKLICKKIADVENARLLTTYYVYNENGLLSCIITPKAYRNMQLQTTYSTTVVTEDLLYRYTYDKSGRLISKKIPGKEKTEFVYDNLNRVILQQDGNLRGNDKWIFYKYDILGRLVLQGVYENAQILTQDGMQIAANTHNTTNPNYETASNFQYNDFFGYTSQSFPELIDASLGIATYNGGATYAYQPIQANFEVLYASYYDNYDFDQNGTSDYNYMNSPYSNNVPAINNKNRLTGTTVKKVGDTGYLEQTYFYNFNAGRLIQTAERDLDKGIINLTNFEYNFVGNVIHSTKLHVFGANAHSIVNRYTYDSQNRLVKTYQKMDGDPEIVLSEIVYNRLGQPIIKKLNSNNDDGNYLQNIDYEYHI